VADQVAVEVLPVVGKMEIENEIIEAEKITSAAIHVHVSTRFFEQDTERNTLRLFHRLHMNRTHERNSVLIYINPKRKKFSIYGDKGAHEKLGDAYWQDLVKHLREKISEHQVTQGLVLTVKKLGQDLAAHFPRTDKNPIQTYNLTSEGKN